MTFPGFIFGMLFATFYGVIFHLATGGGLSRLIGDILVAWLGFWAGHFLAAWQGWSWGMVGTLRFAPATLSTALLLILWLYLAPPSQPLQSSD